MAIKISRSKYPGIAKAMDLVSKDSCGVAMEENWEGEQGHCSFTESQLQEIDKALLMLDENSLDLLCCGYSLDENSPYFIGREFESWEAMDSVSKKSDILSKAHLLLDDLI